jgi:VWFA-related protein
MRKIGLAAVLGMLLCAWTLPCAGGCCLGLTEDDAASNLSSSPLPDTSDHAADTSVGFTVRRDIPEVRLHFSVSDAFGRTLTQLSADDVRVFDDQAPVIRLSEFERAENLPLEIGIAIDTSDSVVRVLPEEKAAALKFLDRILRPSSDTAFVVGFGGSIKEWQPPTAERQPLIAAIAHVKEPGWGTRFYDAVYASCQTPPPSASAGPLHRALIVLSDGNDSDSLHTITDVVVAALSNDFQIYALTIRKGRAEDNGANVLRRLANATGGRVYVAASSSDLDAAFTQIERDLRTQYFVSFPPQRRTAGYHSLRVEVLAPQNAQVHARTGYYATAR